MFAYFLPANGWCCGPRNLWWPWIDFLASTLLPTHPSVVLQDVLYRTPESGLKNMLPPDPADKVYATPPTTEGSPVARFEESAEWSK